jgi:hypothetical protein
LSKNPPLRISAAEKAPVYAGFGNEIFKNGGFSTASLCASGAGLSRAAGMASETSLCVVTASDPAYGGAVYTARRLTPTECAKLQGFEPAWGKLALITDMPESEAAFWNRALETRARILDKRFRPKSRKQLVKWYNRLHSDSAEYKLWGNGVTLPCVAYIMRGIAEMLPRTTFEPTKYQEKPQNDKSRTDKPWTVRGFHQKQSPAPSTAEN